MAKVSTNPITNIDQDWGNDPNTGLPFSGKEVQAFIKGELKRKAETADLDKKVDAIAGKGLSTEDFTTEEKAKLASLTNIDISGKVDKEEGKGLSTNDFTTAEKTKLEGIAEGATRVIVDDTIKESTNAVQNSAVKKALDGKADNSVFTESTNGLVPKSDTTNEKSTAVLTAEGTWMPSYDASMSRTKKTFLAAPINADGKADFRAIALEDLPDDSVLYYASYGVSWKPDVADPVLTRVGNMSYHKTLPIQNNMKGCIAKMKDGVQIMYYLDPTDWRWRTSHETEAMTLTVNDSTYTITHNVFSIPMLEHQWIKINNIPCEVLSIDTSTSTATIKPDSPINAGNYDVEIGAVLNGYEGEVMVEVPEFWIKSWDTDTRREVRISPVKIDDTWEHQPRILIGAYKDTLLNIIPENMGYLSTLEANSAISVCNIHDYCRGGNNSSEYDGYITSDRFRSMLGKPITDIKRPIMRNNCRRSGKEILSYLQYKRVLYWLYVIEYANFNSRAKFNSELTSEGFRQGGLGDGVTRVNLTYWAYYNARCPITPNGYTNEFGNGTNIKAMTINMPTDSTNTSIISLTQFVPRWHGIENPFGDTYTCVDGVLVEPPIQEGDMEYSKVYATDDPKLYSESLNTNMKVVGKTQHIKGYIKEWDLGSSAEIVPRLIGGDITQYKCAYYYKTSVLRQLQFGGKASDSPTSSLGTFYSMGTSDSKYTYRGFRSSCVIA